MLKLLIRAAPCFLGGLGSGGSFSGFDGRWEGSLVMDLVNLPKFIRGKRGFHMVYIWV